MAYAVAIYIEVVPNRKSPPAIWLRESWREGGKVRKRTLCNLTNWPTALVESFRALLKGDTVISKDGTARDVAQHGAAFTVQRTLPHGHVAAVLGTLRAIGLDRLLGPAGNRCRDLVIAMIMARVMAQALTGSRRCAPPLCRAWWRAAPCNSPCSTSATWRRSPPRRIPANG